MDDDRRDRLRKAITGWVRRSAAAIGRMRPAAVVGFLSACAVTALIPTGVPPGAGLAEAAARQLSAFLGSMGGNFLAAYLMRHAESLDGEPEEFTAKLAEAVGRALEEDAELRAAVAELLRRADAAGAVVEAALDDAAAQLGPALMAVEREFAEFRFLLTGMRRALEQLGEDTAGIRYELHRLGVEQRAEHDRRRADSLRAARTQELLVNVTEWIGALTAAEPPGRPGGRVPYRGLLPYEEHQHGLFFGRARLTQELVEKLGERLEGVSIVIVSGPSGAGKTSLLRAGLRPALMRGALAVEGSSAWPVLVLRPTATPFDELAAALARVPGGPTAAALARELAAHPGQAHLAVRQALTLPGERRLIIVLDQFEELFTQAEIGEETRGAYITALHAIASGPALVVLGVRADHWGRCAAYPELTGAMQEGHFIVRPMTEPDLVLAIAGPAAATGLTVAPALVDTVLRDLRPSGGAEEFGAGALPLLSQALLCTWQAREGSRLTLRGYELSGGVTGAVRKSADDVYEALPEQDRDLARRCFTGLVTLAHGRPARRRVPRADLRALSPGRADAVLESFAAARLLILDEHTVEIAHDCLLTAWPRLRAWLQPDVARQALYDQFVEDAAQWSAHARHPSYLYREVRLTAVRDAARRWDAEPGRYPPLPREAQEFLHASQRSATRAARRRAIVTATLAGSLVLVLVAAVTAFVLYGRAARDQRAALAGRLEAQSEAVRGTDPDNSRLLAAAAYQVAPEKAAAWATVQAALLHPHVGVIPAGMTANALAVSPDGTQLAVAGFDKVLQIWRIGGPHPVLTRTIRLREWIRALAFCPDGKLLAVATEQSLALWGTRSYDRPAILATGVFSDVAFGTARQVAAVGDGRVLAWRLAERLATPVELPRQEKNTMRRVAFSPRGWLQAGGEGLGPLWRVPETGRVAVVHPPGPREEYRVDALAFGPDGDRLVMGATGPDQSGVLWAVDHPRAWRPYLLQPRTPPVTALAFDRAGRTLAGARADGGVGVWDLAARTQVAAFSTGSPQVKAVALAPDGHTLLTAGTDAGVRVWDLRAVRPRVQPGNRTPADDHLAGRGKIALVPGRRWPTVRLGYTASGGRLVTVTLDQQAQTSEPASLVTTTAFGSAAVQDELELDRHTGRLVAVEHVHGVPRRSWEVAGDGLLPHRGTVVLREGGTGGWRIWTMGGAAPVRGAWVPGGPGRAMLDPAGRLLAVGDADGLRLWDVSGAAARRLHTMPVTTGAVVFDLAFSPDGRTLIVTGPDAMVRVLDLARPSAPVLLAGHTSRTAGVAFSGDGRTFATGGLDDTVRLWDSATRRQLAVLTLPPDAQPVALAFSPGGRDLAVIAPVKAAPSAEGVVGPLDYPLLLVWDVAARTLRPAEALRRLCAGPGGKLTPAWRAEFLPGFESARVC
ncbi:NACHT and WD repeat domain-containing protein [Nonomuraea typhae]|uniref:NACHT and WD repeat domain-containing protein n=1 Tax=Nonomuraea typhae TaxID=2603600 RepID=A0ABW7Z4L3_9ACTN